MTPTFAGSAARLATLSGQVLGWRPHEFWTATPAELLPILAPPARGGAPLSRAECERLMEHDR